MHDACRALPSPQRLVEIKGWLAPSVFPASVAAWRLAPASVKLAVSRADQDSPFAKPPSRGACGQILCGGETAGAPGRGRGPGTPIAFVVVT